MAKTPKIGDQVTYYYWIGGLAGGLQAALGKVTAVHPTSDRPQAIALIVDFPDDVVKQEGFLCEQTYAELRTHFSSGLDDPETQHDSGTWSLID